MEILELKKPKHAYPILLVDNLTESFGDIDKDNKKNPMELTENERIMLTLIAKTMVEIIIKEEL